MGRLALMAEKHYQKYLPETYNSLNSSSRPAFFLNLEAEAQDQIDRLADDLAGPDPDGETFQARANRLQTARREAESQVIREFLLPDPEQVEQAAKPDSPYPTPLQPEPASPEDRDLQEAMNEFAEAAADLAEMQPPSSAPTTPDSQPTE
jgi:hypothetical protein